MGSPNPQGCTPAAREADPLDDLAGTS
jgi:hypothetical protein